MYKCKLCGKVSSFRSDHEGHHCPTRPQVEAQINDIFSPATMAAIMVFGNDSSSDSSSSDSFSGGGGESGGGGASSDF